MLYPLKRLPVTPRRWVARCGLARGLLLVVLLGAASIVLRQHFIWDALHAKDLDARVRAASDRVLDRCQSFFVHLRHVNAQPWAVSGCELDGVTYHQPC